MFLSELACAEELVCEEEAGVELEPATLLCPPLPVGVAPAIVAVDEDETCETTLILLVDPATVCVEVDGVLGEAVCIFERADGTEVEGCADEGGNTEVLWTEAAACAPCVVMYVL